MCQETAAASQLRAGPFWQEFPRLVDWPKGGGPQSVSRTGAARAKPDAPTGSMQRGAPQMRDRTGAGVSGDPSTVARSIPGSALGCPQSLAIRPADAALGP